MLKHAQITLLVPADEFYGSEQALTFDAVAWKVIGLVFEHTAYFTEILHEAAKSCFVSCAVQQLPSGLCLSLSIWCGL